MLSFVSSEKSSVYAFLRDVVFATSTLSVDGFSRSSVYSAARNKDELDRFGQ